MILVWFWWFWQLLGGSFEFWTTVGFSSLKTIHNQTIVSFRCCKNLHKLVAFVKQQEKNWAILLVGSLVFIYFRKSRFVYPNQLFENNCLTLLITPHLFNTHFFLIGLPHPQTKIICSFSLNGMNEIIHCQEIDYKNIVCVSVWREGQPPHQTRKINITHSFVFSNSGSLISKMITAIK